MFQYLGSINHECTLLILGEYSSNTPQDKTIASLALLCFTLHFVGALFDLGSGILFRLLGLGGPPAKPRTARLLCLLHRLFCRLLQEIRSRKQEVGIGIGNRNRQHGQANGKIRDKLLEANLGCVIRRCHFTLCLFVLVSNSTLALLILLRCIVLCPLIFLFGLGFRSVVFRSCLVLERGRVISTGAMRDRR